MSQMSAVQSRPDTRTRRRIFKKKLHIVLHRLNTSPHEIHAQNARKSRPKRRLATMSRQFAKKRRIDELADEYADEISAAKKKNEVHSDQSVTLPMPVLVLPAAAAPSVEPSNPPSGPSSQPPPPAPASLYPQPGAISIFQPPPVSQSLEIPPDSGDEKYGSRSLFQPLVYPSRPPIPKVEQRPSYDLRTVTRAGIMLVENSLFQCVKKSYPDFDFKRFQSDLNTQNDSQKVLGMQLNQLKGHVTSERRWAGPHELSLIAQFSKLNFHVMDVRYTSDSYPQYESDGENVVYLLFDGHYYDVYGIEGKFLFQKDNKVDRDCIYLHHLKQIKPALPDNKKRQPWNSDLYQILDEAGKYCIVDESGKYVFSKLNRRSKPDGRIIGLKNVFVRPYENGYEVYYLIEKERQIYSFLCALLPDLGNFYEVGHSGDSSVFLVDAQTGVDIAVEHRLTSRHTVICYYHHEDYWLPRSRRVLQFTRDEEDSWEVFKVKRNSVLERPRRNGLGAPREIHFPEFKAPVFLASEIPTEIDFARMHFKINSAKNRVQSMMFAASVNSIVCDCPLYEVPREFKLPSGAFDVEKKSPYIVESDSATRFLRVSEDSVELLEVVAVDQPLKLIFSTRMKTDGMNFLLNNSRVLVQQNVKVTQVYPETKNGAVMYVPTGSVVKSIDEKRAQILNKNGYVCTQQFSGNVEFERGIGLQVVYSDPDAEQTAEFKFVKWNSSAFEPLTKVLKNQENALYRLDAEGRLFEVEEDKKQQRVLIKDPAFKTSVVIQKAVFRGFYGTNKAVTLVLVRSMGPSGQNSVKLEACIIRNATKDAPALILAARVVVLDSVHEEEKNCRLSLAGETESFVFIKPDNVWQLYSFDKVSKSYKPMYEIRAGQYRVYVCSDDKYAIALEQISGASQLTWVFGEWANPQKGFTPLQANWNGHAYTQNMCSVSNSAAPLDKSVVPERMQLLSMDMLRTTLHARLVSEKTVYLVTGKYPQRGLSVLKFA